MESLIRGDRVHHPQYGHGIFETKQVSGRARVRFDREPTLPRTVLRDELSLASPARTSPLPAVHAPAAPNASVVAARAIDHPAPTSHVREGRPIAAPVHALSPGPSSSDTLASNGHPDSPISPADAWQALEALRLGVVPAKCVSHYTVAREAQLASIRSVFTAGSGCRALWGEYGSGKTHLLEVSEQLALELGYAVSRITLDPREQALHHPQRVYRRIAESLRVPGHSAPGIEQVLDRLIDSPDHLHPSGRHASRFFTPYLHTRRRGSPDCVGWLRDYVTGYNIDAFQVNRILEVLEYRGQSALRLPDYRTYGRVYIHLLGTLACWSKHAGYRGLVLIFDEIERVDGLSIGNLKWAFQTLLYYAAASLQRSDLSFDPEKTLYRGGQPVHRRLPIRFQDDQPLCVLFALTPIPAVEEAIKGCFTSSAVALDLPPIGAESTKELVRKLATLYGVAYPQHELSQATTDRILREVRALIEGDSFPVRALVQATVFLLDRDRLDAAQGLRS